MILEIEGSGKSIYKVDTDALTCSCPNFRFKCSHYPADSEKHMCKHIMRVFSDHPELAPAWYQRKLQMINSAEDPTLNPQEDSDGKVRYPITFFDIYVFDIKSLLNQYSHIVSKYEFCGSYRRRKDKVSDLDVLLVLKPGQSPNSLFDYCEDILQYERLWRGDKKASYKIDGIVQVDFKIVPEESWPFATLHFTGSKAHNIEMRSRAKQFGYSLNEYGFKNEVGVTSTFDCKTEEDIFNFLRMPYKAPWDR